jgi:hypothetical protein
VSSHAELPTQKAHSQLLMEGNACFGSIQGCCPNLKIECQRTAEEEIGRGNLHKPYYFYCK